MKMTVVYVKDTGQVMAAVTRAALAETPPAADDAAMPSPEVQALVGDVLPVRSVFDSTGNLDPAAFSVPAAWLVALTVDRDDNQLLSPRRYVVLDGKNLEVGLPPPAVQQPTVAVAASKMAVEVTLPANVTAKLPISLHLVRAGTGISEHFKGAISVRALSFPVSVALAAGTYDVLVLLSGYSAATQQLVVI